MGSTLCGSNDEEDFKSSTALMQKLARAAVLNKGPHRLEEDLRHFEAVWPDLDLCAVRELHGMHIESR